MSWIIGEGSGDYHNREWEKQSPVWDCSKLLNNMGTHQLCLCNGGCPGVLQIDASGSKGEATGGYPVICEWPGYFCVPANRIWKNLDLCSVAICF